MKSWQHNISRVRKINICYLVIGESIDLENFKETEWTYVVDGNGAFISSIVSNKQLYYYTSLCGCINEVLKTYQLPLVFNDIEDIIVYQANENRSFSKE